MNLPGDSRGLTLHGALDPTEPAQQGRQTQVQLLREEPSLLSYPVPLPRARGRPREHGDYRMC